LGEQKTIRERSMNYFAHHLTAIVLVLLGLMVLPFILITFAVLEYKLLGTEHISGIGRIVGIYDPLRKLYRMMPWIWGD
jgi:hypothetical protein